MIVRIQNMQKEDPLASILGNGLRAKLFRIFIMNKDETFNPKNLSKSMKIRETHILEELSHMEEDGILKNKIGFYITETKRKKEARIRRKNQFDGFVFNRKYKYRELLEELVTFTTPIEGEYFLRAFSRTGNVRLLVITGLFTRNNDASADLLIVGDNLNIQECEELIRKMENIFGRDIRYIHLESNEFMHRYNSSDKSIRNIIDYALYVSVNKLGIDI